MIKIRYICVIATLLCASTAWADAPVNGCPMNDDEKLVCSVVLCNPIGLLKDESRSECIKVNKQFAKYLATLGFWKKPPKCKMRDMSCGEVGTAKKGVVDEGICTDPDTNITDTACIAGLNINNSGCDDLEGSDQDACYKNLAQKNGTCEQLSSPAKEECITAITSVTTNSYTDTFGVTTTEKTFTNSVTGSQYTKTYKSTSEESLDENTGMVTVTTTTTDVETGEVITTTTTHPV